jgi:thiol-disulfide isomerase/thioredoxin
MRTRFPRFLALLLATAFVGAPFPAFADEGQPAPAPAPATEEPKADEEPPESPKDAVTRLRGEARKAGPRAAEVVKGLAEEYLAAHEKRGATPAPDERVSFAIVQAMAQREADALATLTAAAKDETAPAEARDEANLAWVDITVRGLLRGKEFDTAKAGPAVTEAEARLADVKGDKSRDVRGMLHMQIANVYRRLERAEDAIRHYVDAGTDNAQIAPFAARSVVEHYVEHAKGPEDYEKARTAARPVLARFGEAVDAALAAAKGRNDERAIKQMEGAKEQVASAGKPLDMLGNPLDGWTVVHSFKNGASPEEYRGKVLLVDFWATWCPWCIKSFPAMRDLLKEYGEKGFAIVGVTTSSPNVFDARWDLDEDMKSKAPADWKPKATLSLDREASDEAKAEHAKKEREVVATFLSNHEVPWDAVMIEPKEPAAKYGLSGWPYGVLVDRKGRVRRLHAGAILRDDAKGMAEMRALIESLLAESGDGTPAPVAPSKDSANGGR